MKKKIEQSEEQHELEIIKAVAQAWHGHSTAASAATAANEFDLRRLNFKNKPTRFKLEAMTKSSQTDGSTSWDFRQSLWDSYELVNVSRRLETGLVLDHEFSESGRGRGGNSKKESKNSLRSVLNRTSSRRSRE